MCQEKCPVKINTGELVKQLRSEEMAEGHPRASAVAMVRGGAGIAPELAPLSFWGEPCPAARISVQRPSLIQKAVVSSSTSAAASCPAVFLSPTLPHPACPPCPPQSVANNFSTTAWAFNKLLNVVSAAHSVLGAAPLKAVSSTLNRLTGHMVPEWNPYMPKVRPVGPGSAVSGTWSVA